MNENILVLVNNNNTAHLMFIRHIFVSHDIFLDDALKSSLHIYFFFFQLAHPNMFLNGEAMTSLEDIRKGSVDDVYNFISEIPSCAEYAQVIQMTKCYYNYIASGLILLCVTCCRHSKTTWLMERRYLFLQRTTSSIHSVWSLGQRLRYDHRYSPSFKRTKFDLNMQVNN